MDFRGYNAKELSSEKHGPDNAHYETVRERIKKDKHVSITFMTKHKIPQERTIFLPYAESQRIIQALQFYDDFLKGKFKISEKPVIAKEIEIEQVKEQAKVTF